MGDADAHGVPLEPLLADVLASVLEVDEVDTTSNFFHELGADSLTMVHFCARLAEREHLPSASIKDIYENPTVRSLALAMAISLGPSNTWGVFAAC